MTARPDEIAAALERIDWQQVVLNGGPPCFHVEDGTFCLRAQRWAGHDGTHRFFSFADLLRAANPPAGEPFDWWCPTCQIGVPPLHVTYQERHDPRVGGCGQVVQSKPEPATPAVGEEAGADCECTCAAELAEKVRALLADVARLQKELDGTTFREERYAEDAVGARLALEDARATLDALFRYRERTRGWSAEYNTFSDTIAAEEGIE